MPLAVGQTVVVRVAHTSTTNHPGQIYNQVSDTWEDVVWVSSTGYTFKEFGDGLYLARVVNLTVTHLSITRPQVRVLHYLGGSILADEIVYKTSSVGTLKAGGIVIQTDLPGLGVLENEVVTFSSARLPGKLLGHITTNMFNSQMINTEPNLYTDIGDLVGHFMRLMPLKGIYSDYRIHQVASNTLKQHIHTTILIGAPSLYMQTIIAYTAHTVAACGSGTMPAYFMNYNMTTPIINRALTTISPTITQVGNVYTWSYTVNSGARQVGMKLEFEYNSEDVLIDASITPIAYTDQTLVSSDLLIIAPQSI